MLLKWDEFLEKGDTMFQYMIHNYDSMFNDNMYVKHFNIRDDGIYDLGTKQIKNTYDDEIQTTLVPWIQAEYESGRLFTKTLWKPFRDSYTLIDMYLGYRVMFIFKQYVFQLSIDIDCIPEECKYCDGDEFNTHFELVLWGWKDAQSEFLQPDHTFIIPSDNYMPEKQWNMK